MEFHTALQAAFEPLWHVYEGYSCSEAVRLRWFTLTLSCPSIPLFGKYPLLTTPEHINMCSPDYRYLPETYAKGCKYEGTFEFWSIKGMKASWQYALFITAVVPLKLGLCGKHKLKQMQKLDLSRTPYWSSANAWRCHKSKFPGSASLSKIQRDLSWPVPHLPSELRWCPGSTATLCLCRRLHGWSLTPKNQVSFIHTDGSGQQKSSQDT